MSIMKIFINRLNISQKSLILVECKAFYAMQYYTANAILIGQAEPMSIFPKPPSPKFITFIALSNFQLPSNTSKFCYLLEHNFREPSSIYKKIPKSHRETTNLSTSLIMLNIKMLKPRLI